MTIKIRFHGDKATIRWKTPMEKQFLQHQLRLFRDNMQRAVRISLKDEKGDEIPPLEIKRPVFVSGVGVVVDSGATTVPPVNMPRQANTESSGGAIISKPEVVKLEEPKI